MAKYRTFEFWAADKDGNKFHETVETASVRTSKVKALISAKYGIDIENCKDFGMRQLFD